MRHLPISLVSPGRLVLTAGASLLLVLGLAACGSEKVPEPKPFPQAVEESDDAAPAPAEPAAVAEPQPPDLAPPPPEEEIVWPQAVEPPSIPEPAVSTADETLPVAGDTSIRVALLLPLTGAHGRLGQDLLDAAQLALFDLALDNFVLMPRDTGGTPEGSLAAAQSALEAGASLILGPLLSTSVEAVPPEARAAGVNVVAFSTDRTVAGDGIFIMGFLARAQIERVITFARSKGLVRFAAIVPTTPYGVAVVDGLRDSAARNYGAVTQVEFYDTADGLNHVVRRLAQYETRRAALVSQRLELQEKDDEIARQALLRLEGLETIGELEFEAILLPEGGDRLLAIAPLLPYYDIDPAKVNCSARSMG